jgi:hypothetical protein
VGNGHGVHEVRLEGGLRGGLDLLDPVDQLLDAPALGSGEQGDGGPGAGGVPHRCHLVGCAVGDEAEDRGPHGVDVAAEGTGQGDPVHAVDPEVVHQQPDAGVERGLGELDGADVVLGDEDPRAVGALVEQVGEGAPVGLDAV